jgi:prepilin-type N-terminal cleavage/methylation domain-containing protein
MVVSARRGLTLLELVIVVSILAVLAGLLVPQLANMWRPAQTAAEADTQGQLTNYLSMFETRTQAYPDQFDSLLANEGAAAYSKLNKDLLASSGKMKLTLATLTDDATSGMYLTSLTKAGIKNVMWHDETATTPSNSGTIKHALAKGDKLPILNSATTADGQNRITAFYTDGLPNGTQLFVLGVGPACTAVGVTMNAAPVSPHPESYTYYRRYLAVFAAYSDGTRARLKGILDRHGDTFDDTMRKYQEESQAVK